MSNLIQKIEALQPGGAVALRACDPAVVISMTSDRTYVVQIENDDEDYLFDIAAEAAGFAMRCQDFHGGTA